MAEELDTEPKNAAASHQQGSMGNAGETDSEAGAIKQSSNPNDNSGEASNSSENGNPNTADDNNKPNSSANQSSTRVPDAPITMHTRGVQAQKEAHLRKMAERMEQERQAERDRYVASGRYSNVAMRYKCADEKNCGAVMEITRQDKRRCRECGHRVLFKLRTRKICQYLTT